MPDVTQNVIIEFISDTTKLEPGVDQLERMNKVEAGGAAAFKATNAEINKQAEALKQVDAINAQIASSGKVTKKNLAELANLVKGMSGTFQNEFKKGIIDSLKEAGISVKQFEKLLDEGLEPDKVITLRQQLKQLTTELQNLELAGKANTKQYAELTDQAVRVKKAMDDVGESIRAGASDTSAVDGMIQTVSTLAGGFAVAQGAAALFGDESEELQKTLLRVNAAMAILQGLQQIQNALQKESAAAQFANTLATKAQAVALGVYNFIVGTSTGLTKAFRIALATTGVGLLVIGLIELVKILSSTNDELEEANKLIDSQKEEMEGLNDAISQQTDLQEARAKAVDAAESEIIKIQGRALLQQRAGLVRSNERLREQRDALSSTSSAWFELNKAIQENVDTIGKIDNQLIIKNIQLEKQLADERAEAEKKRQEDAKKAADDAKRLRDERLQKEKEARAAGFADFKAAVELELLAAEKGSVEELEIKKRLLRAELQQALDNDKLTDNQRKLLVHKFFSERLQLEKDFAKDRDKLTFENQAAGIAADLAQLEVTFEKRLELTETGLRLQAQVEIAAAEGNAAKIAQIEATRDKAIRDARIASIQEVVNYEIALAEATNGPSRRRLQAIVDQGEAEASQRIAIINELAGLDSAAIQKRIDALNKERTQGLISQKDYNLQYAQLIDQQTQVWETAEKKKTDITKAESQKRIEQTKKDIDNVVKVAALVSDILSGINDIQSQRENEKLTADRARIKELQDAGAITEKDAIARMKRLDDEERKIKLRQAKRDKDVALFNAIIQTARGIAEAIPNPFLIALAAATGAAQIALIAARPLPKFAKGKKNNYEGLAQVGEAGSELIERNGNMFITNQPQIVWLGKKDKVYSHKETVAMMSQPRMNTERDMIPVNGHKSVEIDYEKMGAAVGKHVQTSVFVDGVKEQEIRKREFLKYLGSRRKF